MFGNKEKRKQKIIDESDSKIYQTIINDKNDEIKMLKNRLEKLEHFSKHYEAYEEAKKNAQNIIEDYNKKSLELEKDLKDIKKLKQNYILTVDKYVRKLEELDKLVES